MKKNGIAVLLIAAQLLFLFCSCGSGGGDVLMKLGGTDIRYEEYRYFYLNTKEDAEANGSEGGLLDKVAYNIKNAYIYETMAKQYHVSLSKEDRAEIEKKIADIKSMFAGESEYYAEMEKAYMTDHTFRRVLEIQKLRELLFAKLTDDLNGEVDSSPETVREYIHNNFYRATQILIINDEGDDTEENRRLAGELLGRAKMGADFQTLVDEFGEDTALTANADGYYAAKGELLTEFERAALELAPGEISDVTESPLGYHIIKRMEIDDGYIDAHYDEMLEKYLNSAFNGICEKFCDETELKYTNKYYELDFDSIK